MTQETSFQQTANALRERLERIHRLRRKTVQAQLEPMGIAYGQPQILMHISRDEGISQRELATHLKITPASINVSLKRMEKGGLILRKPHPTDGRLSCLYLTDEVRERLNVVEKHLEDFSLQMVEGFEPAEMETLLLLLEKVEHNLSAARQAEEGARG